MNKNIRVVFGGMDHEMTAILAVLAAEGIPAVQLLVGGKPCHSGNAYKGDASVAAPGETLVFIECAPASGRPDGSVVIDHHNPGDPGYGFPPAQFLMGSSLGQLLALLGLTPTVEQMVVAACDHCPVAAYAGNCPGVNPADVKAFRMKSQADFRNCTVAEIEAGVEAALAAMAAAPQVVYGYQVVAVVGDTSKIPGIPEATAQTGSAVEYSITDKDGKRKVGLLSGTPSAVEAWMESAKTRLTGIYGDPSRGYAGGYVPE